LGMNVIKAKELIRDLHKIWNFNLISEIPNIYAHDCVVHWSKGNKPSTSLGHDGIRKAIEETLKSFPDWCEEVIEIIAENDKVVTRYVSTGTHLGTYQGIVATGKKIKVDEISLFRLTENKVAEQWCFVDDLALIGQLKR